MPVIGLLIGQGTAAGLGHTGRYVGAGLLILTGAYAIWQARRQDAEHHPGMTTHQLVITAAALSLDNLVVGFALGVYHVNLLLAAVVMGVVSVGMSLIGLELGGRLGGRVEEWAEELGGGVLILVGIALAAGVLQ